MSAPANRCLKADSAFFEALRFAAERHAHQRRKGVEATPYINHPIAVAETLWRVGGVRDPALLIAALLHDLVEDTDTGLEELTQRFGAQVSALVAEVSDDKSLPKQQRKQLQIEHASQRSDGAKQLKLADKLCNITDLAEAPPAGWSLQRQRDYLEWTAAVVAGLLGVNPALEQEYLRQYAHTAGKLGLPPTPAFATTTKSV